MLEVAKESFDLQKIKLLKGGGVHSVSKLTVKTDGSFHEIDRDEKTPIVPHPELVDPIRNLKEKLLISCNYLGIKTIIDSEEFKASKEQKAAAQKHFDIIKDKTTVTGIHVSGKDKNRGVIISGVIKAENASNIAINSPRLRFESEVYGFEQELHMECDLIEDETYEYLFNGKKQQMDINFDDKD
jgi:hypothetical protein